LEDTPAGFARACARFLLDQDLAKRMGEAALKCARANYLGSDVSDRLAALCHDLAQCPETGSAGAVAKSREPGADLRKVYGGATPVGPDGGIPRAS
jgi:hypothetical protein